jgi:peptidoglycan/xylan/chitin deacetylase (PgdA/CDA1 family)
VIETLRRNSRRLLAGALYYSGILWILARHRLRQRAIAVMYHRVLPAGADTFSSDAIVVTPATFERHMRFLKRHFHLLSVQELARHFETREPLPSMSCVVTFDDGWFDNHQYALPILRRLGIPAVVFAATDYIGGGDCFWQERLARMLFRAAQIDGPPRRLAEKHTAPGVASRSADDQRAFMLTAVSRLKRDGSTSVQSLEMELTDVLRAAGAESGPGDDRFMSWPELVALTKDSRVVVGSHGCSHVPLTWVAPEAAGAELAQARARLEQELGARVDTVGYPNGNYDDQVVKLAREHGYRLGFTTDKGTIGVGDDPLRLRRINISEAATRTAPELLSAMLLVFNRLRRPA